jgi:DNA polymerase V
MKLRTLHKDKTIELYSANTDSTLDIPVVDGGIKAGFPSPAQDFLDLSIDLNKELVKNPTSTFYGRVSGDSMQDVGISDGDLLVIDKSLEPRDGKIAVCYIDGEFTVKSIKVERNGVLLMPANDKYSPIRVTEDNDFIVWGIVIHVIKSF